MKNYSDKCIGERDISISQMAAVKFNLKESFFFNSICTQRFFQRFSDKIRFFLKNSMEINELKDWISPRLIRKTLFFESFYNIEKILMECKIVINGKTL